MDDPTELTGAHRSSTSLLVGTGVGLVGEHTLGVFDPLSADVADAMWGHVVAGHGADDLLEVLSSTGLRSLGSFAIAQYEPDAVRIVVRGDGAADVVTPSGARRVVAVGVRTWHEEVVRDPIAVSVGLGGADAAGSPFTITGGIVPAVALGRGARPAGSLSESVIAGVVVPETHLVVTPITTPSEASAVEAPTPLLPEQARAATPADSSATISVTDLFDSTGHGPGDVASAKQLPVAPTAGPAESPVEPPIESDDAGDEYDAMWGHTMARPVEAAAVRPAEPVDEAPPPSSPTAEPPPEPPPPLAAPASNGLIAAVPLVAAPLAPAPDPTPAIDHGQPDHDGRTMTRAQIQALKAQVGSAPVPPPAMGGPAVQAVVCTAGHASPPHFHRCRVCGVGVDSPPVMVSRPSLGSLRFSDGTLVALDRPAVVGRNPRLEGAMQAEIPAIVRLDVGQGLSRSHAIMRIEGWQVLVEDLNSANGTIAHLPGRAAQRLRPGEPLIVENGTTIDFGGEISCVVELL